MAHPAPLTGSPRPFFRSANHGRPHYGWRLGSSPQGTSKQMAPPKTIPLKLETSHPPALPTTYAQSAINLSPPDNIHSYATIFKALLTGYTKNVLPPPYKTTTQHGHAPFTPITKPLLPRQTHQRPHHLTVPKQHTHIARRSHLLPQVITLQNQPPK